MYYFEEAKKQEVGFFRLEGQASQIASIQICLSDLKDLNIFYIDRAFWSFLAKS